MRKLKNSIVNILLLSSFFLTIGCGFSPELKDNTKEKEVLNISRVERIKSVKLKVDSINKSLVWRKTNFDLWKSKNGILGLKTQEGTSEGIFIDRYIRRFPNGKLLGEVIDTTTFGYLGSSFYKDKNHIYTHYDRVDGGSFWIVEDADVYTFRILGGCYAKDKNYIFGERAMRMDSVDYKTFKTCNDCACHSKDKNGYYFWDTKIKIEDISEKEVLKIIKTLDKL